MSNELEKGLDPDYPVMIVCFVVFTVLSVGNYHPIYGTTVRQQSRAKVLKLKEWRMSKITCLSTMYLLLSLAVGQIQFCKARKKSHTDVFGSGI